MADFDWNGSSLTQDWWMTTGATIGASEKAIKFACCKFMGKSNTESARLAGYGGHAEANVLTEGYRCARSNKVVQLLSLAAAEAGGGIDGSVLPQEARQILSHLARGIKALEALAKMHDREKELIRNKPEESLEESLAALILAVQTQGVGSFLALESFLNGGGAICNFPYLPEVAPLVARYFPSQWQRWRAREKAQWVWDFLDKAAANPVLEETVPRLAAPAKPKESTDNATA